MKDSLFTIDNFNIIEDDEFFYVFRALEPGDHEDINNESTNGRLRTDRERYEEAFGSAKYGKDSDISLEEVWDHIKIRYSKETNCISLSTNANVCLDYGNIFYDDYMIVRIPKKDMGNYYYAGRYMLQEIAKSVEDTISNGNINSSIRTVLNDIDNCNNNDTIIEIMKIFSEQSDNERSIMSRFQNRQYFNQEQQLEYNKLIAKVTILEIAGIKESILPNMSDNSSLLATVNNAFSSGEAIHYKDINKSNYSMTSKRMITLFAIVQQLKDKNVKGLEEVEKRLLYLVNHNYDVVEKDGKIVITNGVNTIDCNLPSNISVLFKDCNIDNNLIGIKELYNITSGNIDYSKARKTIEFCYNLALAKREVYDYATIIAAILGNDSLTDEIIDKTFTVKADFIDRGNGKGYKLCESVNIGVDNTYNNFYSLEEQRKFIDTILDLDINSINSMIDNHGLAFRNAIVDMLPKVDAVDYEKFYATSIVNGLNFEEIFKDSTNRDNLSADEKEFFINELSKCNVSRLYESFLKRDIKHEDICRYIFNLFIEGSYKGHSFYELCKLDNLDDLIEENINKLNKKTNLITLSRYFGVEDDMNYISNSYINLRDFQMRIKESVDEIYASDRRFAGVILPTGGGKSFIAMAEMLKRKDENIVYIAPRLEILRQFKKHIVKYVAGIESTNLTDKELDSIVRDCFPHLDLYCYQGLSRADEEKLKKYDADFIILDELHHVGAETWNPAIKSLLVRNPNSKVLGITATPIRDNVVDSNGNVDYEAADMMRAMAVLLDDYTPQELTEKRYLACDINIIDAIQEGYVVCPSIVSFDYNMADTPQYKNVLKIISREKNQHIKEYMNDRLAEIQGLIRDAELRGVNEIIRDNISNTEGRYILFIPRNRRSESEETQDTEEYISLEIEKFKQDLGLVDNDPIIEYIYSGKGNKENAKAIREFENNDSDHMKILVAIDMLNEGVHLEGINGSFNYRKIDSKQLILLLQHLGRTIFALDPSVELEDKDLPVIFDKFNNYSNMDLERLVNKTNTISDLEKLRDIVFWTNKYGFIPQTNSENPKEKKKAITLRKIQKKYSKYVTNSSLLDNLSNEEKYEINEILRLGKSVDLWEFEFEPISVEEVRKVDRVNIFDVSATQRTFLDLCKTITKRAVGQKVNKQTRIDNILTVLDYLAEYNVVLSPDVIDYNTTLDDILNSLDSEIKENILFELDMRGIDGGYFLGEDYYFVRREFANYQGLFKSYNATVKNIIDFRKYGILVNGEDFNITNEKGFIMRGPKQFWGKNVWTGTKYSPEGFDARGYDAYGFDETGINKFTRGKYNVNGFDAKYLHKVTHSKFDNHGFNINRINKNTNDYVDEHGFDIDGYWYRENDNGERVKTPYKYDDEGYDIEGYDKYGFDREGINKETQKPYDSRGFGKDAYYWKEENGTRVKTDSKLDERNYDRNGNLYKYVDGKLVNQGRIYDEHGFYSNDIHYLTHTKYDPRGFDVKGMWHPLNDDGTYGEAVSKYNDRGWDIDGKTIRHNVYGIAFIDYVDEHGFDEDGLYHLPIKETVHSNGIIQQENLPFDEKGFKNFYGGTFKYKKYARTGKYKHYDIHGFDCFGVHSLTGTNLNPNNFDIDGYYYVKDENGEMINTGKLYDDFGFTIDQRRIIKDQNNDYCYVDRYKGFDANKRYYDGSLYNNYGFDIYGIHKETGTIVDTDNYDVDGYWYTSDDKGNLVKTNSKYNDEGWSRDKVNVLTNRIVDQHGFDYYHLYHKKSGEVSIYDNYGFDYTGTHRKTKNKVNANNFDIDGYWYKKENKSLVRTNSKYDSNGYDIDRLDRHKFSKNGYYCGTKRRYDDNGFDVNGINNRTNRPYDLNGLDIDGVKVELTPEDVAYLNKLITQINISNRMGIEDIFEEIKEWDRDLLLESSYDIDKDEIIDNDYLEEFIQVVYTRGIKDDNTYYTNEDIFEFIKEKAAIKYEEDRNKELYEMYKEAYRSSDEYVDYADEYPGSRQFYEDNEYLNRYYY